MLGVTINWFLVHANPWQEKFALENLQWRDYEFYFPVMPEEKLQTRYFDLQSNKTQVLDNRFDTKVLGVSAKFLTI